MRMNTRGTIAASPRALSHSVRPFSIFTYTYISHQVTVASCHLTLGDTRAWTSTGMYEHLIQGSAEKPYGPFIFDLLPPYYSCHVYRATIRGIQCGESTLAGDAMYNVHVKARDGTLHLTFDVCALIDLPPTVQTPPPGLGGTLNLPTLHLQLPPTVVLQPPVQKVRGPPLPPPPPPSYYTAVVAFDGEPYGSEYVSWTAGDYITPLRTPEGVDPQGWAFYKVQTENGDSKTGWGPVAHPAWLRLN